MSTKQRGTGEGTIYHAQDGRWVGAVTTGYGPRKRPLSPGTELSGPAQLETTRRRTVVYAKTRAEVVLRLRAAQDRASTGQPQPDGRITVRRYLSDWLEKRPHQGKRLSPRTLQHYRYMVGLICGEIGEEKLLKVTPDTVESMLTGLQARGLGPRSAAHVRAVFRAALRPAVRDGLVSRNVAQLAEAPSAPTGEPRLIEPEDLHAVLDAIPDPGLRRMATIAAHTGLRQGELLGLRWSDIDWQTRMVKVSQGLQRLGGEYWLAPVKSKTSKRAVPLTGPALEALTQERAAQTEGKLAARRRREPIEGLVFTTAKGMPRNGTSITHAFGEALAAAGLPPMTWHGLRHAYAVLMLTSREDLAVVSHLLGHSSLNLTLNTYGGIANTLKRRGADRLERLLAQ